MSGPVLIAIVSVLFASSVLSAPVEEVTTDNTTATTTTQINTTEMDTAPSKANTTTFSCYGRPTGYYADTKLNCAIYHFCTSTDAGPDGTTFERMSYVCMDGSLFDQKDLSCVMKEDMRTPCNKAESEYESSNKQFDKADETPSIGDSIATNLIMNPLTRFIAGR